MKVDNVDFHGCAVAVSPGELDKVRVALSAKKAQGSTCEVVRQVAGPIKVGKTAITDRSTFDLSKAENRRVFDAGLRQLRDSFTDDPKHLSSTQLEGRFQAKAEIAVRPTESVAGTRRSTRTKSVYYSPSSGEDRSVHHVIDEQRYGLGSKWPSGTSPRTALTPGHAAVLEQEVGRDARVSNLVLASAHSVNVMRSSTLAQMKRCSSLDGPRWTILA